jgi:hypothetical protein
MSSAISLSLHIHFNSVFAFLNKWVDDIGNPAAFSLA